MTPNLRLYSTATLIAATWGLGQVGHSRTAPLPAERTVTPLCVVPIEATCLSGDGNMVGGSVDKKAAVWDRAGGVRILPMPEGTERGWVTGLSNDGEIIAGVTVRKAAASACIWSKSGGVATMPTSLTCVGPSVSADGTVVGDQLLSFKDGKEATVVFRWRKSSGFQILSHPNVTASYHALVCSGDGDVVFGCTDKDEYADWRRFRSDSTNICRWDGSGAVTPYPKERGFAILASSSAGDLAIGKDPFFIRFELFESGQFKTVNFDSYGQLRNTGIVLDGSGRIAFTSMIGASEYGLTDPRESGVARFDPQNPVPIPLRTKKSQLDSYQIFKYVDHVLGLSADGTRLLCGVVRKDGSRASELFEIQG